VYSHGHFFSQALGVSWYAKGNLLMEGWLTKRGPTPSSPWRQRWCVLLPATLEYYADRECKQKKGSIAFLPQSVASVFRGDGATAEAAKYSEGRPFGFVIDVDPSRGKDRSLIYFDAKEAEVLDRWVKAIDTLLLSLGSIRAGDAVIVNQTFMSNSEKKALLEKESAGLVITIDEDGDALIEFDDHIDAQWVHYHNFYMLSKHVETLRKQVLLEVVPQDALIMHWAVRVGSSPTSRCYEFEDSGLRIGKNTKLDKGLPIERIKLRGYTVKTYAAIDSWARAFEEKHEYSSYGDGTLGGKNCQDFAVELCDFLGVDTSQLPWRQARVVKTSVVAGAGVVADLALGTGILTGTAEVLGAGAGAMVAASIVAGPEILAVGAVVGAAALAAYGMGILSPIQPPDSPQATSRSEDTPTATLPQ